MLLPTISFVIHHHKHLRIRRATFISWPFLCRFIGPLYVLRICGAGLNLIAVSGYFPHLVRLTVTDCCGIAMVTTAMADKIARLTDIKAKNARLSTTPSKGGVWGGVSS